MTSANGGNGGFVELSSDDEFGITGVVDTTAANGQRGTFLLDPRDLVLRVGTRPGIDLNLYESDIEFLSSFTDIDLEARRNFTVASNTYGASDGVITLADGSSLTIRTTNEPLTLGPVTIEANNNGRIDLTGNAAYGANLEFKTSGAGSINILGATANNQSSNITLSKLTTESGNINVNTNNGSITWNGNVTTQNGNVTGTSTGQNYIGATIATNGGDVALSGGGANFWDTGILLAVNGVINTAGGNIDLTANNTKLVINGKALAGSGDLSLKAPVSGRIEFWGAGELQGDVVDLQSGLGVTQGGAGSITANLLTGDVNQSVELSGLNKITEIGNFETGSASHIGGFVLNNVSAATMKVAGALSTQGGHVSLTNNARADVKSGGSVVTNGGNLVINANNNSWLYIDGIVNTGAGNTTLNAGSTIVMRTGDITTGTLTTTGKVVEQWASSVIKANLLEGSLTKDAEFLGVNNDIVAIGDFSTGVAGTYDGGFKLVDNKGVQITKTLSTQGGAVDINSKGTTWTHYLDVANTGSILANGGNVKLASHTGGLTVKGNVNAGAGDIDLSGQQVQLTQSSIVTGDGVVFTAGRVFQGTGSTLLANVISGVVQSDVVLQGANNDVARIGNFTTGAGNWHNGGFTLIDVNGFDVVGALSSDGGDIILRSKGTLSNESIDVIAGGSMVSGGGDITLDSNGTGGGFTTIAGVVNAGAGDVNVNARQFKMSGTGSLTADDLVITAGAVTQTASSRITANRLTGTTSASAFFDGVNNDIVTLDDFATGASNWSNGQFRLVDTNGLTVDGIVSTYGTTRNPVYGDGSVSITTTGGALNFANTSGAVTNGGRLAVKSNTLIDVDQGANIALGNGAAHFDAPQVNLGDDIGTSGPITGTASLVYVENPDAQIQDGIDVAAAGATVNIAAGTFNEGNININKNLLISGATKSTTIIDATGFTSGFIIDSDLGNTNTTVRRLSVNNARERGLIVTDAANLKVLQLNQTSFNNNGYTGVSVFGDSMKELRILNSDFSDNGNADGSRGDGDILAYQYNGDVTLTNVTAENNSGTTKSDYGIQIRGADVFAPSGTIKLDNVKVSGSYRAGQIGIQKYDGATISMNDVVLGGQSSGGTNSSGWASLYLSELGGANINIGNTAFGAINGQYIMLGREAGSPDVDARGATFEGISGPTATLEQNFAIEDKVAHDMDVIGAGHVTWHDNNEVYVTTNTLGIQRGVDLANVNDTVHVANGVYRENVMIDKSVTLRGYSPNAILEYDVDENGPGRGTNGNLITVAAENVTIEPFTFDGLGVADYGINADNSNTLVVRGNSFEGFALANINVTSSRNAKISNNVMTGAEKGIAGDKTVNIQINDNEITDTSVAGIYVANSNGTNNNNDVDIWKNTIKLNNTTSDGIVVLNSKYATVGVDSNNPFAAYNLTGGNKITGGKNGIVVDGSERALIVFNTVENANESGIVLTDSDHAVIRNNLVDGASYAGIRVAGSDILQVVDNTIQNGDLYGVYAQGAGNGALTLVGNRLLDNAVGARFESGAIDISDALNPNRIINAAGGTPVGLQFAGAPAVLSIIGDTLGSTVFSGFNNPGSYYVRFENGSILDPVTAEPTLIDGLKASFDDFIPPVSGLLTQDQYDFLESRLYDADDAPVNGRGQIFVGLPPVEASQTLDNIEDFFDRFAVNGSGANIVQLIITGLPSIGQPSAGTPGVAPATSSGNPFDPAFLAGLEPAAGGDGETGAQDGQNANNIEPQGGEEQATCWGDALSYASGGRTASYSFGGSLEDSMAQQASCVSGS